MNGIMIVDKPKNCTSRDVVNELCHLFSTKQVGHTGTLDPMATGVLVIAFGRALKLVEFLSASTKEYLVTMKLGMMTDTLDVTGKLLETKEVNHYTFEEIECVLQRFVGKIQQEVPIYSAVRKDGKRLYEYARNEENVELPIREVEIFSIKLVSFDGMDVVFETKVSKGTYIRSLVRDIGETLGCSASMSDLRRTAQGDFSLQQASSLEEIQSLKYHFIEFDSIISDENSVFVDEYIAQKIKNGSILENRYHSEIVFFKDALGHLLAVYEPYAKDNTRIKPKKVFK